MSEEQPTTELVQTDGTTSPTVPDETISEVVASIRAAQAKHGFALIQDIGRLIVEKFYGGDIGVLRDRGPKDASLRQLADHPDLPMSASGLYRAVATYDLIERQGGVAVWKHLGPSHVRAVLPVSDKDQRRLLGFAEKHSWTVKKLEEKVRKIREDAKAAETDVKKRGRPPLPRFVKSLNALERYATDGDDLFGDLDAVDDLDGDEAQRLYQTVTGLKLKCEELEEKLRGRVPGDA